MTATIILIAIILLPLSFCFITYLSIKKKLKNYSQSLFGTSSLRQAAEYAKINEENTPKSITGMEPLNLPYLIKDFPNIEINEFKKMAENTIIQFLKSIEKKQLDEINNSSEKVKNYIQTKIDDVINDNISYDSIKIHKTVLNKYIKNTGKCCVIFYTSLEYQLNKNNESKKIQSRFKTEYIYVIDEKFLNNNLSGVALNCPNCGAPIRNLGQKKCAYCGSGVIDLVKKTWILNDIQEF